MEQAILKIYGRIYGRISIGLASFCSYSSIASVTTQFISLRAHRRKWLHHRPTKITQRHWWVWYWQVITGTIGLSQSDIWRRFFFSFCINPLASYRLQVPQFNWLKKGIINLKQTLVFFYYMWVHLNMAWASSDVGFGEYVRTINTFLQQKKNTCTKCTFNSIFVC